MEFGVFQIVQFQKFDDFRNCNIWEIFKLKIFGTTN